MKTLKDHTIFYDAVCPMCNAYTNAFVQSGMLDSEGRGTYQQLPSAYAGKIDLHRAVNEIALINRQTGEVHYGINSMFLVIGHSFPFLQPFFRNRLFAWLANKIYRFISYNRRVIMPASTDTPGINEPAFHASYRMAWLVFTWLAAAFLLHQFSHLLTGIVTPSSFYREFLVCAGQMVWQLGFVSLIQPNKTWDYLGNMMTVSFAGGILLLPALILSALIALPPVAFIFYFGIVVTLMLVEHIRRTKVLRLSWLLTLSWVVYRLILLTIIC
jgi:predicted DCC family thiol-disulfide oxidoreductase YuxK